MEKDLCWISCGNAENPRLSQPGVLYVLLLILCGLM